MPANARSRHWAVRVDEIEGVAAKVVDWCRDNEVLLCVREESDGDTPNPHYHALIASATELSEITMRERVKRVFGVVKDQLSVKVWKTYDVPRLDDGAWLYLCKGPSKTTKQPPVVVFRNTLDDVMEGHERFWSKRIEILESARKTKKNVKADVVAHLVKLFDKKANPEAPPLSKREVVNQAVDYYKGKCSDFQLIPVVQAVWWHYHPVEVREGAWDRVAERLRWF